MKEKREYNAPEIQIITLKNVDVITASGASSSDDGYSQYYPDPFSS